MNEYSFRKAIFISFDVWQNANGRVYHPALGPPLSALCRHEGQGGYEHPSKQSFVLYTTAKKFVQLIFVAFEKTLPGPDHHLITK
jgi:hypothetical protein